MDKRLLWTVQWQNSDGKAYLFHRHSQQCPRYLQPGLIRVLNIKVDRVTRPAAMTFQDVYTDRESSCRGSTTPAQAMRTIQLRVDTNNTQPLLEEGVGRGARKGQRIRPDSMEHVSARPTHPAVQAEPAYRAKDGVGARHQHHRAAVAPRIRASM